MPDGAEQNAGAQTGTDADPTEGNSGAGSAGDAGGQQGAPTTPDPEGGESSSAGTQNADTMIPKSRFDEVNDKLKEAEAQLATLDAEAKKRQEDDLAKKEKWQELAEKRGTELEESAPKLALLERYETWLASFVDGQLKNWPEEITATKPEDAAPIELLEWMTKMQPLADKLMNPAGPGNGPGPRPASAPGSLTPEEQADRQRSFTRFVRGV